MGMPNCGNPAHRRHDVRRGHLIAERRQPASPALRRSDVVAGYTADMTDSAGPENEPDAGNAASVLPPHLAALIGALNGPPDLARQHDKYLAYPDREEHGGVASA